ncbi:MAG TPA: metallophosphoesterase [Chitinophagaceae bacterium]|nr:metallophosphoesterase [Chitinophagaceae bacterium]
MRKEVLLIVYLFIHLFSQAQGDSISRRLILIGDAGQLTNGKHPVVDAVKKNIPLDNKTTVLYLGDNLYRSGLPDVEYKNYNLAKAVLDTQISIANGTKASVLMIPGNHDWENGKRGGYNAIMRQQLYVDFFKGKAKEKENDIKYQPEEGCPGPVKVDLGNDVVLILFDSQWWLHPHEKPEIESDCNCKTKDELITQIGDIAARNSKKLIILACHHPFKSNGAHGGYFTLKQHLFPFTDLKKTLYIPLPVIGSAYPVARSVFGSPQDISHPVYTNMINRVTAALKTNATNVVFVSGHDHNLQLLKEDGFNYVVSGGGCKQNRTSKRKNTVFNTIENGFSVLEVTDKKDVYIRFYTVTDSLTLAYSSRLLNFSSLPKELIQETVKQKDPTALRLDTITKAASQLYKPVTGLKKMLMGQNYRREWSTPVNMKVLHLDTEKGGLTIESLGGGTQTRSLKLVDKNGKKWVLRTINKYSNKANAENSMGTSKDQFKQEIASAAHPYAATMVPGLAEALSINAAKPEIFYVPADPALGIYEPLFADNVCTLEPQDAAPDNADTKTTAKVFYKNIIDDNDHRADQPTVLKARLLDILIGDFDRHFDQWKWLTIDSAGMKGKIYEPIPRDRDMAFFNAKGKIFRLVAGKEMPYMKGFRHDIKRVNWLGYIARDFDRIFLNTLSADQWKSIAEDVANRLTDSVISRSVKGLPPEIFSLSGKSVIEKLQERRKLLVNEAMDYYDFLSREVNVIGSNQKEYFRVSNHPDGLQVRVYERSRKNDTSFIIYNRVFNPSVTKEIHLFGLNNEDYFEIDEDVNSSIRLRLIGGRDNDTFNIKGNVRNVIYDLNSDLNFIKNSHRTRNRFSNDPPSNERSILGHSYNSLKFPQLIMGYNYDDGFMIGAGITHRKYGFLNLPYATEQQLSVLYATERKAWQLRYRGEFNKIGRKTDLLINAVYNDPALTNFTGFGNNTLVNDGRNFDFYRVRYRSFEGELLFRRRPFETLQLMAGPFFYHYNNQFNDNRNTLLAKPRELGLDSASLFSKKSYAGLKLAMQFDNRNNLLFPTRGLYWTNDLIIGRGVSDNTNGLTRFSSDMTIYVSQNEPPRAVLVLGFGGTKIFSDDYEFFQAASLGMNNRNIHGFRKYRFIGKSSLYASAEARIKLFNNNGYLLPGQFGITGFYDAGRVWHSGDHSGKWHGAYGGGLYFIPYNSFMITATAGFTENERLLNFSIGTKMNLTF